ncbi:MAG: hypothetical protein Q8K75_07395 [Chlamydiales bacterium]|nr:hypothetical protein [Chlamydiales bacterium]
MEFSKDDFYQTAEKVGIPQEKVDVFWSALEKKGKPSKAGISISELLFYFGAMIIISAMTWFMSLSWEWFGGGGIFLISVGYALLFSFIGARLWVRKDLKVPGGLLITVAVCMVPLAIYGLQTYLHLWPEGEIVDYPQFYYQVNSNWLLMEVATICAGLLALKFFPFPFLTFPIFFSAWFMSMDIVPFLTGQETTLEQKEWISMTFGIILIVIAFLIDVRNKGSFAFWAYFFGVFTFWGGLTSYCCIDNSELAYFTYFVINLAMMALSIPLKRKVFLVFGAIGANLYIAHLAYEIFKDSLLFPFALSGIGLGIIFLGIMYQKHAGWIEIKLMGMIPDNIRKHLP